MMASLVGYAAVAFAPQPLLIRQPATLFPRSSVATLALSKAEKRRRQKLERELAHVFIGLNIPGNSATHYSEVLAEREVGVADLANLPPALLDACDMRSGHRQILKGSSALLVALSGGLEPSLTAASATPPRNAFDDAPPPPVPSATTLADSSPDNGGGDATADEEQAFVVSAAQAGSRVDAVLASQLPPLSRSYFGALCTEGRVSVDGASVTKKSLKLDAGARVVVRLRAAAELSVSPEDIPLSILYEDEHFLAVDKPSGMVVHPAPGHWNGTFANALAHHVERAAAAEPPPLAPPPAPSPSPLGVGADGGRATLLPDAFGDGLRPGIVHRLDRYTTGVLLGAKTENAQRGLLRAFSSRQVSKVYLAVTAGVPSEAITIVTAPIGRHPVDRVKMSVVPEDVWRSDESSGRVAMSVVHTLASDRSLSLVAVRIGTGRTHQIRVHLQHLRTPVLGDPLYGDPGCNQREKRRADRPLLHAYRVQLAHPTRAADAPVTIVAPPPDDVLAVATALTGKDDPAELGAWLEAQVDAVLGEHAEVFDAQMRELGLV